MQPTTGTKDAEDNINKLNPSFNSGPQLQQNIDVEALYKVINDLLNRVKNLEAKVV